MSVPFSLPEALRRIAREQGKSVLALLLNLGGDSLYFGQYLSRARALPLG